MKETSMATALQDKIDKRASVWEQMKAIDLATADAAQIETYDRLEAEYDALETEVDRIERQNARAAKNAEVDRRGVADPEADADAPVNKAYEKAFARWMSAGLTGLDHDDQAVLNKGFVQNPMAAAGVGTNSAGGYTVPPEFRAKIVEAMNFVANMRQFAEGITTETGANLPWPTNDDSANEGAILAENTQVSEQDVTFGQGSVDAYMYTSKLIRVSFQLLNDSAFNLEAWLAKRLGQRIGRIQNRHFTVGTGTGQPDGLFTSASSAGTTAGAAAVTLDELIDLSESVDESYLAGGNCRFMFNQGTRKAIRKLKYSGSGEYAWQPSVQAGKPSTLLGHPVALNNHVAALTTGNKAIGFGDIEQAYLVRDVTDLALLRLSERYADFLQVGFLAFQRSDGTLQDSAAFKVLTQA